MASVIKKTTDVFGQFEYFPSVNTPDYSTDDWEHNPDVSGVTGVAQKYWKYDGTNIVVEMSQGEKDAVDAALRESGAVVNDFGNFIFGNWGRTQNRYLRSAGWGMPCNHMPSIFLAPGVISGLYFSNYVDNADSDVQIFINDSVVFTWEIRDKRYAYKTNELSDLLFAAGDKLVVRMKSAGTVAPMYPIIKVQFRYNSTLTGEGGSGTL